MGYLSRRRGVISVFLLIIFMITYVFMGMLVDAGRYRMAQTYMESALDSASSSVLSSYNKLVFDLYGLFSTDITLAEGETMESKIEALYNSYLQETLGIIDVDTEQYSTLLNNVLHADEDKNVLTTKSLYDFQITELDAGTSVTLANTSNVENQIIEYMKFRAPVELMGEVGEFMEKLNNITQMDDRIAAAQEKREITKQYENDDYSVSEHANLVLVRLDSFMKDVITSTEIYQNGPTAFNFYQAIVDFDRQYGNTLEQYHNDLYKADETFCSNMKSKLIEVQTYWVEKDMPEISLSEMEEEKDKKFKSIDLERFNDVVTAYTPLQYIALEVKNKAEQYKNLLKSENLRPDLVSELENFIIEINEVFTGYEGDVSLAKGYYDTGKNNALKYLQNIQERENDVASLWVTAYQGGVGEDSLYKQLSTVKGKYEEYIQKLESKKSELDNESDKATYDADIQQLKSSAAIVVEKMEFLKEIKPYFENIGWWIGDYERLLSKAALTEAGAIIQEAEEVGTAQLLKTYFGFTDSASAMNEVVQSKYQAPVVKNDVELIDAVQKSLCCLFNVAKKYEPAGKATEESNEVTEATEQKIDTEKVMNQTTSPNDNKEESDTGEEEQVELVNESFTVDMLKIEYQANTSVGHGFNMDNCSIDSDEKLNMGVFDKLLGAAGSLITQLGELLKGARDNLYVDAYIMSTFPNYYTHYQKRSANKEDELISAEYAKYNASWAEVEFIITGGNPDKGELYKIAAWAENASDFGWDSVNAMKSKMFGIRLALNAVSMFTDPGRYSQAMTISSWAGLFAPLVACVLMIAWTVAETALDVLVLTGEDALNLSDDGTVPLYKGSSQWYISMGGVLTALANNAVDVIAGAVASEVNVLASSLETELNAMLYDVYVAINDGTAKTVDEVYKMVEDKGNTILNQWSGELKENMSTTMASEEIDANTKATVNGKMEEAEEALNNKFSGVLEDSKQKVQDTVGEVTEAGMEQAKLVIAEMKNQVMDAAEEAINGVADQAKDFISENISKIVPTGTSGTAACPISLGYEDYLYLFLFLMDTETKIQRVQAVIQANMQVGGQTAFKMENAPVAVWADLECSMKYMFMSNGLVPESMKRDGRLRLKVISAQSY